MQIAALIAAAFSDLDVTHWLVPDAADGNTRAPLRQRLLAGQFAILVDAATRCGHVDVAVDESGGWVGAAVWADRTGAPFAPVAYETRLKQLTGTHLPRFQALDRAFEDHHPTDVAHLHLMFLATVHGRQGSPARIGTTLLAHGLARADQNHLAVYLEAASERLRNWYQRYDFAPRDPIRLPHEGPSLFPMLRPPQ
ncbi:hypothetical protein LO763_20185 [Glycomyces sp. A-F 0318]|uniref:hypothetical protein n=1 Tax=Glycomyces amatae TaxID=2881355 RepID=UPI001E2AF9C5|nr:hypothetical protein [Glycomyces amatae]MCD0445934.1 hypothetical protein [Glycomyces amatae]